MSLDGLWIQSVATDGELFLDSQRFDGVIRTQDRDTRILFGFSNSVSSTVVLSSAGAAVAGDLAVDGGRLSIQGLDVAAELSGIHTAIGDLRSGNDLADSSITSNAIADSNVPPEKILGVLPVSVGGTGSTSGSFPPGSIPFGAVLGDERLETLGSSLSFDPDTWTFAASNATVQGRLHSVTDFVTGKPGGARYRIRVDPSSDLVMTRIEPDGSENEYINFRDVKALLDNVGIQ